MNRNYCGSAGSWGKFRGGRCCGRFSWYRPREGDYWLVNEVFALLKKLQEPVAWRYFLYECVRAYYGEKHQFTAYMALRVAGVYDDSMRFKEALGWYELSYRLYGEAQPADYNFYVEVGRLKARLCLAGGEYQKAYEAVKKDLELCVRYQGESMKMTLGCRELLGDILQARGDVVQAEEEYLKVLFFLQEKYSHQNAWMERLREKLGDAAW